MPLVRLVKEVNHSAKARGLSGTVPIESTLQSQISKSPPALARIFPSAEKAMLLTTLRWPRKIRATPVLRSHIRTVRSSPHDPRDFPEGLKATLLTPP